MSSFSGPHMTILSASSGNGRCAEPLFCSTLSLVCHYFRRYIAPYLAYPRCPEVPMGLVQYVDNGFFAREDR